MNKEDILELIAKQSREVIPELGGHTFKPTDRLTDLGANSVDRAEIISLTMEALSLRTSRVELFGAENIGQLADLFYEKLQSA